ncbi:MAG TPA: hypothetical protein VLF62_00870 [Candidatus Saccharimonadales bacterium]|nr:hypothetical protein [Candidatus Saccharimonadales bacterium]
MSAEQTAHDESLYYLLNQDALFAVADRVDSSLDGRVTRVVAEQVRGSADAPTIVEGATTPERVTQYYKDWHDLPLTEEQATHIAAVENDATSKSGAIAIRAAVQLTALQRLVLTDRLSLFGVRAEDIPVGLNDSRFTSATWRQARLRISGGELAVCENVTLSDRYGSSTQYHSVRVRDTATSQELTLFTGPNTIFKSTFIIEPSRENHALRAAADDIIGDWPGVRRLLAAETDGDLTLYENIRDYLAERTRAGDDWAQHAPNVDAVRSVLFDAGRAVRTVRAKHTVAVNGTHQPAPETIKEIGRGLGHRLTE